MLARAPGRINLIGEHTDYNDGYVLPFAIDRGIEVAAAKGASNAITVHAAAFAQTVEVPVDVAAPAGERHWQNYIRGIVAGLRAEGVQLHPAHLWIGGDLPDGFGMASSAALCVATALALACLAGAEIEPTKLVRVAQEAERRFAGTPCGVMDPYVSLFGRAGYAVFLDCRNLRHELVPVQLPGYRLLAIRSGIRRQLSRGPYEQRVMQCQEAVEALRQAGHAVNTLRDVTQGILESSREFLTAELFRRVRHVVTEHERVRQCVGALHRVDLAALGSLLNAGHDSLRNDYGVSRPEIEELIRLLRSDSKVLGARMMGGGFGGTILALVRSGAAHPLTDGVFNSASLSGEPCEVVEVHPADGAWVRCF